MKSFLARHWFLLALGGVLVLGLIFPAALAPLTRSKLARDVIVASVLFLTALPLETAAIALAIRRPWAASLACLVNFGLLPVAAIGLAQFLDGDWATGLLVAAAAPGTIASAAVWTRRAGGNDVIALIVTVVTNSLCFVITPLWLSLAAVDGVEIELWPMIRKLSLLVLLPMVLAQLLRRIPRIAKWSIIRKPRLSVASQLGILAIVLIGAIHCGLHLAKTGTDAPGFLAHLLKMLCAVVGLHASMLWVGQALGRQTGLSRPDWIAVGFAGSQKTLMVGLQVALMIGGGLTILPMVAYHFSQLMIDTLVADRLKAAEIADKASASTK